MEIDTKPLTIEKLTRIVGIVAVRLERLEELLVAFIKDDIEQGEFQTTEILKIGVQQYQGKIPAYRLAKVERLIREQDDAIKGVSSYLQRKLKERNKDTYVIK